MKNLPKNFIILTEPLILRFREYSNVTVNKNLKIRKKKSIILLKIIKKLNNFLLPNKKILLVICKTPIKISQTIHI